MSLVVRSTMVLLVEDTMDDELLALRALRRLEPPVDVRVARDGDAALSALGLSEDGRCDAPDLVICDLKLPKVGGVEVLRRVRAESRLHDVPFVVFSSSDEAADVATCEAHGATEIATKPIEYSAYMEQVKAIVRRHVPAYAAAA